MNRSSNVSSKAVVLLSAFIFLGCNDTDSKKPPNDASSLEGVVSAEVLAQESELSGSLKAGERRIYQVASDSDVSLISDVGDVDLFLLDNVEDVDVEEPYSNEKNLCGSYWGFKEDVCSASVTDGELYALVVAHDDTSYRIGSTSECSVETVNNWVYRNMQDYYLYSDQVPQIDPATFSDPSDLVKALRFEDLDRFSSINDAATQSDFFENGTVFGLGYGWAPDVNDNMRMLYIFDDAPFGKAGINRGDLAISINEESMFEMSRERYSELVGTRDNPKTSTWEFIDGVSKQIKRVTVTSTEYTLNSVVHSGVYTSPNYNGKVGYIVFNEFIEPTVDELDIVIAEFKEEQITDLVLDLRYNGGGRSRVGQRLASQIAGPAVTGKVHSSDEHNNKYTRFNYDSTFPEASPFLEMNRLIVLTSESTASASERLINALRPFMEVVTLGSTTTGKAFSSSGRRYCGKVLNAMQTQGVNAVGVSVAGGISADCFASDDTLNDFGAGEGMFQSALDYLSKGSCVASPQIAARSAIKDHLTRDASRYPISEEQSLLELLIE